jgi:hypothetical protein
MIMKEERREEGRKGLHLLLKEKRYLEPAENFTFSRSKEITKT